MARRKRSYVPKVKGCYECSHRRIDCDRTEPACLKCTSRGIECSGLGVGIKFRFRDGLAQGRKQPNLGKARRLSDQCATSTFQVSLAAPTKSSKPTPKKSAVARKTADTGHSDTTCSAPAQASGFCSETLPSSFDKGHVFSSSIDTASSDTSWIQQLDDSPVLGLEDILQSQNNPLSEDSWGYYGPSGNSNWYAEHTLGLDNTPSLGHDDFFFEDAGGDDSQSSGSDYGDVFYGNAEPSLSNKFETPVRARFNIASSNSDTDSDQDEILEPVAQNQLAPRPCLNPIDAWNRWLLNHFCDRIAPEMVIMDGMHNGWRHVVLPIALRDELVMSSVLAASAFHINGGENKAGVHVLSNPRTLYAQAIRKLQLRRELDGCDKETRKMVILAIVVLLVVVMINGCSDFPVMFRMLESALDTIGGDAELEKDDELSLFCLREIRKMRVYAAPLISEDAGLRAIISSQASQSFDCLRQHSQLYPEYADMFHIIEDLRRQAFNIYLQRALHATVGPDDADPEDAIEHFIRTVQSVPPDAPGQHVLVWPCFIAASASREQSHREFLQQFLFRQYLHNGFANILRAMDLLQRIWARGESEKDWTALLPEPQVFIM